MNTITRFVLFPSLATLLRTRLLASLAAAFATLSSTSTAAPGDLDLTFGGTGKVITDIGSTADRAYGVALQADGQIVVAGARGFGIAVVRYKTDGSLVTSFNGTGKVITRAPLKTHFSMGGI